MSLRLARYRWLVYIAAAGATLLAMRWAASVDGAAERAGAAVADPGTARGASLYAATVEAPPGHPNAVRLDALRARTLDPPQANPFAARSWEGIAREEAARSERAHPRVKPRPAPRPRPQAPPLPFRYLGRMVEDGTTVVFLAREERNYIARAGEALDDDYSVASIGDEHVVLVYRPLDVRQTLAFGQPPAEAMRPPPAPPGGGRSATRAEDEDEG
jgi:hypothetical protein